LYQILVTNTLGSAMVPGRESMGLGEGNSTGGDEYDPNGPPLIADEIAGMECSLVSKTAGPVMQCREPWRDIPLPAGCTMCKMGCGIAAVSSISMRVNSSLNPEYWTKSSVYSSAGCGGTSDSQARNALLSINTFSSSDIRYDGGCSPTSIARSICDGNKLVILAANFYKNSEATRVGGHFVVVVGVRNGEIVVMDPYYDEDGNGDGYTTPFLRTGEVVHYGAIHSIQSCLVINADKIN